MMKSLSSSVCFLVMFFLTSRQAVALQCYECDSSSEVVCGENLAYGHTLEPVNCEDHLQGPQFCVKKTGLFDGMVGTKRFCSSRDFGNYCEWVMRPGDEREYRSCVYTCSMNACNTAARRLPYLLPALLAICAITATMLPATVFRI